MSTKMGASSDRMDDVHEMKREPQEQRALYLNDSRAEALKERSGTAERPSATSRSYTVLPTIFSSSFITSRSSIITHPSTSGARRLRTNRRRSRPHNHPEYTLLPYIVPPFRRLERDDQCLPQQRGSSIPFVFNILARASSPYLSLLAGAGAS
jgi:hypothetical protein